VLLVEGSRIEGLLVGPRRRAVMNWQPASGARRHRP